MKPTHTQKTNPTTGPASWRQRIDEALSSLKTAPPEASRSFTEADSHGAAAISP
jgi:hypothetical protein